MRIAAGLTLLLVVASLPATASARPGTLDPSFGKSGLALAVPGGPGYGYANAVEVQSDGKIVAASPTEIVRYLSDGSLDASYGDGGVITHGLPLDTPRTAMLAGDALLIGTGTPDPVSALQKRLSDGSLDPTFGVGGVFATTELRISAIGVQPDGKILLAGIGDFGVLRLNADGSVDTGFGTAGIASNPGVNAYSGSLALQPDGGIVVGGSIGPVGQLDFVLTRYDSTGAVDPSFGAGGVVQTDTLGGSDDSLTFLLPHGDGVVAVGQVLDVHHEYWFVAVRYMDGVPDPFFGVLGVAQVNFRAEGASSTTYTAPFDGVVDPDSNILITGVVLLGASYDLPLMTARLEPNGALDSTFGSGGKVVTRLPDGGHATAVAIAPDGDVVVAGGAFHPIPGDDPYALDIAFALTRYEGGGAALPRCPHTREFSCHEVPDGGRATLKIKNDPRDKSDALAFSWSGAALSTFGDPTTTDAYALCVYAETDGFWPPLRYAAGVNAGGTCGAKPCWKATTGGFTYKSGGPPMGIAGLKLQQAGDKTKILLKGSGRNLGGMSFLPVTAPLWVQLHALDGECWSSSFWYPAKNDARQLVVDMVP